MQQFVMTRRQTRLQFILCKKFYHSKYPLCCCPTNNGKCSILEGHTQTFSFRNKRDVSVSFKTPWKLFKNIESRMTSAEHLLWVYSQPNINRLGHTREAEPLNAHGLCFPSCEQQFCLLYLHRAPENSRKLLFEQEENPDHKPVVFYSVKNNPVSEPNTNPHMLGGSPPESTPFISS